mmetsp:Transcript_23806/g.68922  ORF Transcript_23806/g.68922 Transcript_23806/m.68922 type:complete len:355 (+) Transcript_23806:51-1115(+)
MGKRKGAKVRGGKGKKARAGSDDDASVDMGAAAVADGVDLDIADARMAQETAQEVARAAEEEKDGEDDASAGAQDAPPDPYLMADAKYIEKDTRWRNKQRTLVFASRGVTARFRYLLEDVRKLLPHHKSEPKFEKKANLHEINEVCELKSCNNVVYFEARKMKDLYMWVGRIPSGPTMKFQVHNIHTTGEVRLAGNCLLGSRPILYFDQAFQEISYLKLVRTLFTQVFGTPRNHPKSKPFHDHILGFYWLDGKIWVRHYQISPDTPNDNNDPERQQLTEIGPRFVLDPIKMLAGSFSGQTIYANAHYMSPTALRVHAKRMLANPYIRKKEAKADREERIEATRLPEDPTDEVFH